MRLAKELEAKTLTAKSDLKLIMGQVNGEYQAKDSQLIKYLKRVTRMAAIFEKFTLHHVPREANNLLRGGKEDMDEPPHRIPKGRATAKRPTEAKKLVRDATKYIIIRGELYKRGFSFPLLHCVEGEESKYVVKEVHEGVLEICEGDHDAPRAAALHHLTLAISQMRGGHSRTIPTSARSSEVSNSGNDYFTKWIEAEPMATISAEKVKHFYWKKITCHFGLSAKIVSNNGTQFASWLTASFCAQLKIKQQFTSMEHP
ncbi:hypothetical protein CR513_11644, partial [Mucuna pruriens]